PVAEGAPSSSGWSEHVFSIEGPRNTGFGGFGVASGVSPSGREWIAIASPNEEGEDGSKQVGKIRVYIIMGEHAVHIATFTSAEREPFGKFGMTMAAEVGSESG